MSPLTTEIELVSATTLLAVLSVEVVSLIAYVYVLMEGTGEHIETL